ncbi:DUF4062 domain-containing protein [Candidatus Enterococcus ferrettii]|uniref:DUF4062 domain-containing protein n=1 Tax=Candidatus Enterococcus ferrettii TaxID=2815324 RepID=A0ABV0EJ94_9ENTE|nr:DUF4062 domain-containing protein [Enterococcus sp. 665A]MBO1338402.1 DUF4062 domain-containing protein [Enterococcus sp. 665A]
MTDNYGKKPTIFISSTCYDLKQIRTDIKKTLEDEMGFETLLSEYDSFPLDPSLGTVETCLRAVEQRADIFVLVIGGKYGYKTDNGKSVTNLEYLQAKGKGIPIYTFVNKSIINALPLWKANPNGDFSSLVDTNDLFHFVDELRNKDNIWVYEYEFAQEICNKIKNQFAYLFNDSLKIRNKFAQSKLSPRILEQSPEAIKLVLEKNHTAWELKFFFQVFWDQLNTLADYKRDLEYKVFLKSSKPLDEPLEIISWITYKNKELIQNVESMASLINVAFPIAIGESGKESDLDFLIYIAVRMVKLYQKTLEWEIDLHSILVPEEALTMIKSLSSASQIVVKAIDKLALDSKKELSKIPAIIPEGEKYKIDLSLSFESPDLSEFNREFKVYSDEVLYG